LVNYLNQNSPMIFTDEPNKKASSLGLAFLS